VRLINDWPNPSSPNANADKVPTIISYDENGQPKNFGYSVDSIKEQGQRWFKLLLDPQHKYAYTDAAQKSNQRLRDINQTAETVAADYLRLLWAYTKADIRRMKGENWESTYDLQVVLTVPAIWTHAAKERTKRVAKAAGILGNISLVTEPEAAALAVLKDRNEEEKLQVRGPRSLQVQPAD
jgi:molecular chaperone DnaK (HSP70)